MIETITPAVCGSRRRHRFALAAFTVGAVAAAALLGGLLGLAGSVLGAREVVLAAAVVAALAAAREAGLVRFPLPQARVQVPERWHMELPLPVWATGYGAGLGIGLATYQPVATFWVACAAALALGRPLTAAACLSLYGLGRALMVIVPQRRAPAPGEAVERLVGRRRGLRRANAVALAACATLLAFAPAAGAEPIPLGAGRQLDPSWSDGVLAYAQRDANGSRIVVRVSDTESHTFTGRSPSLEGARLAFADAAGVAVVDWRNEGALLARVPSPAATPALAWPWLAYRRDEADGSKRLMLTNLETRETRELAVGAATDTFGRPAISYGRVAWTRHGRWGSRVLLYDISTGNRTVVRQTRISLLTHPTLTRWHVFWVWHRSGASYVRAQRIGGTTATTVTRVNSRTVSFWTMDAVWRTVYVTRWSASAANIHRVEF